MKVLADDSLLARRDVQRLLVVSALCFGSATWGLEAILSRIVQGAPPEPFGGVYRLVESVLWIGAAAIAIRIAERWPIENIVRDWRRALAQLALAIALGPVWGILAYAISPYLMPWWHERGMWGVVAKEAKGALFGYGVTTGLVHAILRVRRQRAREVTATAMERAAAEAQLVVRKLELQPASVLRALDAIARMIPHDVDAANEALVALADGMRRSLALSRVQLVTLREELGAVQDAVRLRELTIGPRIVLSTSVADDAAAASLPAMLLPPLVDRLVNESETVREVELTLHATIRVSRLVVAITAPAGPGGTGRRADVDWLLQATERIDDLFPGAGQVTLERVDGVNRLCIELPWRGGGEHPVTSDSGRSSGEPIRRAG